MDFSILFLQLLKHTQTRIKRWNKNKLKRPFREPNDTQDMFTH